MVNLAFGRTLEEFRKRARLTQEALAREVGIGGSMISRYEHNRSRPTPRVLQSLINTLALHQLPHDELDRLWELADLRPPGTEISTPVHPIISFLTGALESLTTSKHEERLFEEIRATVELWQGYSSADGTLGARKWAEAKEMLLHLKEQEGIRSYRFSMLVDESLGWAYYGQGQYVRAVQCYHQALLAARYLELHQQGEEPQTYARTAQARVHTKLGDTHRRLAQWDTAEDRYTDAEKLFRELGDLPRAADCLRRVAAIRIYQGRAEEALREAKKSLAICRDAQDKKGIYKGLEHKAWALEIQGDWDEAARLANEAIDMVPQETDDEVELAKAYGYLADKLLLQGHPDQAGTLYLDAQRILRGESVAKLISGQYLLGLGRVYLEPPADLLKAQQYLNESLEQHIELGEPLGEARTQNQLGRLLVKLGQPDLAEWRFRIAADHFEASRASCDLADARANLAELYYGQGNMHQVHEMVGKIAGLGGRPSRIYAARARFVEGKAFLREGRHTQAYQAFCEAAEHALAFNHYIFDEIQVNIMAQIDELVRSGGREAALSLCNAYVEFFEQRTMQRTLEEHQRELIHRSLERIRRKRQEIAVLKHVN